MAAHPHDGREGAAEERACVGYLLADVNSPHSKGTLPVYRGSDTGACGDSQGVGGGWS
jgi:hypothetical protein